MMFSLRKIIIICLIIVSVITGLTAQEHHHDNQEVNIKFIENRGQFEPNVSFKASVPDGFLFSNNNSLTYLFYDGETYSEYKHHFKPAGQLNCHAFRVDFLGSHSGCKVVGENKSSEYYNYFLGNDRKKWASGVYGYYSLLYKNLYKGIDAELAANEDRMEYNFFVSPGADAGQIRLKYTGTDEIYLESGMLHLVTSLNEIIELMPVAYQFNGDEKSEVPCSFNLNDNILSFSFPQGYNSDLPLVIDPVIIFATFSGSAADNFGYTATYDDSGYAYSGGTVFDIGFPVTTGAFQINFAGGAPGNSPAGGARDIGILKYSQDGSRLIYATYLGGNGNEDPHSMVVNSKFELIVFGNTGSTNFPIGNDFYDSSYNGNYDIYIARFSSDGKKLSGSTYIGGNDEDGLNGKFNSSYINLSTLGYNYGDNFRGEVNVDKYDNIYVVTTTKSSNFPVTPGAFQTTIGGGMQDACILKMSPSLNSLLKSSFLGGNNDDAGYGIAFDNNNNIYLCGGTKSTNLPVTAGKYQSYFRGGDADGYIYHITNDFSKIINATFFGTGNYDQTYFIQTDKNNNVYVTGQTKSDSFPIRHVSYFSPKGKQFISKLNPGLDSIIYSTVFGSGDAEPDLSPSAFLVDICERVYFSGWGGEVNHISYNQGYTFGLPVTPDGYQKTTDGSDFYLVVFSKDIQSMLYASYFGGPVSEEHVDGGTSRFDKKGVVYQSVCGGCGGFSDFPTTPNAWSTANKGHRPGHSVVDGCNNAMFKIDLFIPDLIANFTVDSIICKADSITITNLSKGANRFLWYFGDGNTSTAYQPRHRYADTGTYRITLIASNVESCGQHDTISMYTYVYNQAEASFSFDTFQCTNNLKFTPISRYAKTFAWNFGDGNHSHRKSPVHYYKDTGIYLVTLIADSGTVCQFGIAKPVHASDFAEAGFNVTIDTCQGKAEFVNLSVNSRNYYWNFGDNEIDTLHTPVHFYKSADSFTIMLIAEYQKVCADTVYHDIYIRTPKADILMDIDTCHFDVRFVNPSKYTRNRSTWDFGDGDSSYYQDTVFHHYNSSGGYNIVLVANLQTLCQDTVYRSISIPELPVSDFNSRRETCSAFVKFYNKSYFASKYYWDFGNGSSGNDPDSVVEKYLADSTFRIMLVAISPASCRDTFIDTISIDHLAFADFLHKVDTCTNHVRFENKSSRNGEYIWHFGDNHSSTVFSPQHLYDTSGKYTVSLIVKDSLCRDSISKNIEIYQPPVPDMKIMMDSCSPWVRFKTSSDGVLNYFWDFGDGLASSDKEPKHKYNDAGLYRIIFYVNKDTTCQDSLTMLIDVKKYSEDDIIVPNVFTPNNDGINDLFTIKGLNFNCQEYKLYIYNRWGEIVYESEGEQISWDGTWKNKTIDAATYYWVLKSGSAVLRAGTVTLNR